MEVKLIDNSVWMKQDQLVSLYQVSKFTLYKHIKHILGEDGLDGIRLFGNSKRRILLLNDLYSLLF